jgi:hypothetical protein
LTHQEPEVNMHAVIVNVTMPTAQADATLKVLHEHTLPRVKELPGVVRGFWTRSADGAHGTSMVVFDSRKDADQAAGLVRNTAPPSVAIESIEVREVVADV